MTHFILKIAVWLSLNGFHSEANFLFDKFPNMDKIGIQEYYQYNFFYGYSSYELTEMDKAKKHLGFVTDAFNTDKCPKRYLFLAQYMKDEIVNYDGESLLGIEKDMNNVRNLLDKNKVGPYTIKKQKDITDKLDKQIKDLEDAEQKQKDKNAQGNSDSDKGDKYNKSAKPQDESKIAGSEGKGEIDQAKLKKYAENWGNLPPVERAKAITDMSRDLPQKYRVLVEDYYKALNKTGEKP